VESFGSGQANGGHFLKDSALWKKLIDGKSYIFVNSDYIFAFLIFPLVPRSKNEWSYTSIPPIRLHGMVLS
jgi:hypothetical protein